MSNTNNDQLKAVLGQIITKCWEDDSYKAEFIANPEKTIQSYQSDFSMVSGKSIVVSDHTNGGSADGQNDPNTLYINIPSQDSIQARLDELELTDAQLEQVAGGWTWVPYAVGVGIIGDFAIGFYNGFRGR